MATNRFFDGTGLSVSDGSLAKATQINSVTEETNSAFDLVQSEIDAIGQGSALAYAWAEYNQGQLIDNINFPTSYSSRANAEEAEAWASGTAGVSTQADGVTTIPYSANERANAADASASAASTSETNALASENKAQKWAEETEDVPVEIGEFSSHHWAIKSSDYAGDALISQAAALTSENKAHDWAEETEDVEVDPGEYSAHHWAIKSADAAASISDTAYGPTWNADTTTAPSKNAVYDKVDAMDTTIASKSDTATTVTKDSSTGAASLPVGTTAQRPTPATGHLRFNTTDGTFEGYNGAEWGAVGGGGLDWSSAVQTANFTAEAGLGYNIDNSSGSNTVTLPASPAVGDIVALKDTKGVFADFELTIGRNGSLIEGEAADMVVDSDGWAGALSYSGATDGWVLIQSTPMTTVQSKPFMHVQHQETLGIDGGDATAGENLRAFNTVIRNEISGASLSAGKVTLPAGAYYIEGESCHYSLSATYDQAVKMLVKNASDATLLEGTNVSFYSSATGDTADIIATVKGYFSISASQQISLVAVLENATTDGMGYPYSLSGHEVYGDLCIWRLDAEKEHPRVFQPINQPVVGAYTTGGIFGGELVYVDADSIDVNPYSCMSDDLTQELTKTGLTRVDIASPAINTIYHIFAVLDNAVQGVDYDTDVDGATLPGTVTHKRWLGFVRTNSSGNICGFVMTGDYVKFSKASDNQLGSVSTSYASVSHSVLLPTGRIELIEYGVGSTNTTQGSIYASDDGTNVTAYIGIGDSDDVSDTDGNSWAKLSGRKYGLITFNDDRYFIGSISGLYLYVSQIKLKR